MYYYLDKDDGYAKGPYSFEGLKQLSLPPETHIYYKPRREWRLFSRYQNQFAAEARQAATQKSRKTQHKTVTEKVAAQPAYQPQKPHKAHFPEVNGPEVKPAYPAQGQPPVFKGAPAMGVSGVGCFVLAVLFVLLVIGFILLAGN